MEPVKKTKINLAIPQPLPYSNTMKDEVTNLNVEPSAMDKFIAEAKAKREAEAKAHRDMMAKLEATKKMSIFAK